VPSEGGRGWGKQRRILPALKSQAREGARSPFKVIRCGEMKKDGSTRLGVGSQGLRETT